MNAQIFGQSELASREEGLRYTPSEYEMRVCSIIATGNTEDIKKMLPGSYPDPFVIGRWSDDRVRQRRYLIINSTYPFPRAAMLGGLSQYEAFDLTDQFVRALDKTDDADEMSELFNRYLVSMTKAVRDAQTASHNPYARKAIRFVHSNVDKKMTVKMIAEMIGITPNYLSSLFWNDTGIHLNEYIGKTKINEAKYLLANTDKSYLSISNQLNFASQSHFITRFEKIAGMTPKQFRQKNQF